MKIFKRLFILSVLITAIIVVGKVIPEKKNIPDFRKFLPEFSNHKKSSPKAPSPKNEIPSFTVPLKDWQTALVDSLFNCNGISAGKIKKYSPGYWEVSLPTGKSLIEYSMELNGICRQLGIDIVKGFVLGRSYPTSVFVLKYENQDLKLVLKHGRSILSGSKKIALIFTSLDDFDVQDSILFLKNEWKKNLTVKQFSANKHLYNFTRNSNEIEILIRLPLEPFNYPYQKPGEGALFIHNSEKEVQENLKDKLDLFPYAAGFASIYGGRAIENQALIEKIFKFIASHNLGFLDLTGSQRSLSISVAHHLNVLCKKTSERSSDIDQLEFLKKTIISTRKYGESVIVFKYSKTQFIKIDTYISGLNIKSSGLEFCFFSELNKN